MEQEENGVSIDNLNRLPSSRCSRWVRHYVDFLMCTCCTLPTFGWFNVRHFQVVLVSMLLSLSAMTSSASVIVIWVMRYYNLDEMLIGSRVHQIFYHTIYFYGSMITQLGGSVFVNRFDHKYVICGFYFTVSVLASFIPIVLWWGSWSALIIIRFTSGVLIGLLFPVMHQLIFRWSTRKEVVRSYTAAFSGSYFGHAAMILVAFISNFCDLWWGSDFMIITAYGVLTVLLWLLLGAHAPELCHYITLKEQELIEKRKLEIVEIVMKRVPWMKLLSNIPFYGLLISQLCSMMMLWMALFEMPFYFTEVFECPIWKSGLICAIPHIVVWISCYPVGYMVELFIRAKIVNLTTARKMCDCLALGLGGLGFISLGLFHSLLGSVTSYTLIVSLRMYHLMGGAINHLDLSPKYASLLVGISRGVSDLTAIVTSIVVNVMVPNVDNPRQWAQMFYITGVVGIIGGVAYLVLGSADVQTFNYYPP